jgi:hypothetical protein
MACSLLSALCSPPALYTHCPILAGGRCGCCSSTVEDKNEDEDEDEDEQEVCM